MTSTTSFVDLGVPARMAEALTAAGMTQAFPVQAITLPDALAGRDLLRPCAHRFGQDPRLRHPADGPRRPGHPQPSHRPRARAHP